LFFGLFRLAPALDISKRPLRRAVESKRESTAVGEELVVLLYLASGTSVGWVELLRNPSLGGARCVEDDGFRKTSTHPTGLRLVHGVGGHHNHGALQADCIFNARSGFAALSDGNCMRFVNGSIRLSRHRSEL
jgi:hypothetical protein